ncbi:MAG: GNAT family N-acetyltransferase [Oscillospiraceae bacterium]|nr:GNAT family N-acetyltransferase [Oscillospiraceae bacterium]
MKQSLGREKDQRDIRLIQERLRASLEYRAIQPEHDAAMAELIRVNLKTHGLDIPGTAYFDKALDHLSAFYSQPGRAYAVLLDHGVVVGGIGIAEFRADCCELQKLYLADAVKGYALGYEMIRFIEAKARALGYRSIYLETHTNLSAAIHVYERSGYRAIPRPEGVIHSAMNRFYQKQLCAEKSGA